jgi:hypothetical protein
LKRIKYNMTASDPNFMYGFPKFLSSKVTVRGGTDWRNMYNLRFRLSGI